MMTQRAKAWAYPRCRALHSVAKTAVARVTPTGTTVFLFRYFLCLIPEIDSPPKLQGDNVIRRPGLMKLVLGDAKDCGVSVHRSLRRQSLTVAGKIKDRHDF